MRALYLDQEFHVQNLINAFALDLLYYGLACLGFRLSYNSARKQGLLLNTSE